MPSLRGSVLALLAVMGAGLVGLGGIATWQAHEGARQRATEQMLGQTHAVALLVDQEFARAEAFLRGLMADPRIASGDPDGFLAAVQALPQPPPGRMLALSAAPGLMLANTIEGRLAQPRPLPPGGEEVFRTGQVVIGDVTAGAQDARQGVSLVVPVPSPGGLPRHALSITIDRSQLLRLLAGQYLPPAGVAALLDRQLTVVARTRNEEALVGSPATDPVRRGLEEAPTGVLENITNQDGEVSVLVFARAPSSGFAVAMAVPRAVFVVERNRALLRLALFALPVGLVALLMALVVTWRLRAALSGLPGGTPGPRLAEVEELAGALAAADRARAETEAALREKTSWLEQTQRAAQLGTWDYDPFAQTLRWSGAMWAIFGLDPARDGPSTPELFRRCVLDEDWHLIEEARREALAGGVYAVDFRIRRGDGAVRWIRGQGVLERDALGRPLRLRGANLDITDRRALEAEREALAVQKDLLVQEMHHRVKNSLQLVQGLLLLQARDAGPEAAARLRDAAGRIVSIAAVHRRLYEGGPEALQDAADHLRGLVEDLGRTLASPKRPVEVAASSRVRLAPEVMASLGLLVTELVTNAYKHGRGRVTVRLATDGENAAEAMVSVADEGPGFPPGFEPGKSGGLGMRVAMAMARQLRGRLEVGPGAQVAAWFPTRPPSPTPADPAANM